MLIIFCKIISIKVEVVVVITIKVTIIIILTAIYKSEEEERS